MTGRVKGRAVNDVVAARVSDALDGFARVARIVRLRIQARRRQELGRPNSATEWEQLFGGPPEPVTAVASPVARMLVGATSPGELLLEAGCGSARVAAELAQAGRIVELCDFSKRILEGAEALFVASGLPRPKTHYADLVQPLPWPDSSFDVVFSSGVLEHWTDDELRPILGEMARVARRAVIAVVPNAACVLYRLGKHLAEREGLWPYGRELPRSSLRQQFEVAGLCRVEEQTFWPDAGPSFLGRTDPQLAGLANRWWASLTADDPLQQQGYLLMTVGHRSGR